jgi:hypothetical protein
VHFTNKNKNEGSVRILVDYVRIITLEREQISGLYTKASSKRGLKSKCTFDIFLISLEH